MFVWDSRFVNFSLRFFAVSLLRLIPFCLVGIRHSIAILPLLHFLVWIRPRFELCHFACKINVFFHDIRFLYSKHEKLISLRRRSESNGMELKKNETKKTIALKNTFICWYQTSKITFANKMNLSRSSCDRRNEKTVTREANGMRQKKKWQETITNRNANQSREVESIASCVSQSIDRQRRFLAAKWTRINAFIFAHHFFSQPSVAMHLRFILHYDSQLWQWHIVFVAVRIAFAVALFFSA